MSEGIGQIIGNFRVDGLITTTSTGTIYKAVETASQEPVALRILNPRLASVPTVKERFLSNARSIHALSHPNIARIEGFGEQGEQVYVATELAPDGPIVSSALTAPGRPLRSHSLWARLDLVRQVADGLDVAHKKNVLHGDLNPKTVLLKRTAPDLFLAKIVDFGLTAALDVASGSSNDIPGNPAYLAPEQWQALQIDLRADVYAMGVILYQIATGILPFAATAPATAMYNHLYVAPQRPCQVRPDLPPELEAIILRCLAKKPQDRFATTAELSSALHTVITEREAASAVAEGQFARASGGEALAIRPPALPTAPRPEPAPGPVIVPAFPTKIAKGVPRFSILDARGIVIQRGYVQSSGATIGSASDNLIVLESANVSPHHARIDWDGRRVTLTDLGSAGSTFLDEHRLLPQVPQEWVGSQQARVGSFWLSVEQSSPEDEPSDVIDVIVERGARNLTIVPGKPAECRVTLANHRTIVDHISISVEGVPCEWVQGTGTEIALNPYDKHEAVLSIHLPRTSSSIAGEYAVTIRANSVADPDRPGEAKVRWTVAPFDAATLGVTPAKVTGRKRGKYSVLLNNLGNRPAVFTLHAADDDRELSFMFRDENQTQENRPKVELAPGAKTSLRLSAESPKWHLLGKSKHLAFRIQAAPQEHGEPYTHEATLMQSPLVPIWVLVALPILLLGLAMALPPLLKPHIRTLTISPSTPEVGQLVTIQWNAARARNIEIRPVEAGIKASQGSYSISKGLQQTTVLTIVASNFFGTDQRQVAVEVKPVQKVDFAKMDLSLSQARITKGDHVIVTWKTSGASRVEFSEQGTVEPEGTYTDTPQLDHTYTLTAYNSADAPTAKSVKVKVDEPIVGAPPKPHLRVDKNLIKQGQSVLFTWDAPGAESARIEAISPTPLTGASGQREAQLKGKGRYIFAVISTNKTVESRSDPVTVDVQCSIIQTATKMCHNQLLIQWR